MLLIVRALPQKKKPLPPVYTGVLIRIQSHRLQPSEDYFLYHMHDNIHHVIIPKNILVWHSSQVV